MPVDWHADWNGSRTWIGCVNLQDGMDGEVSMSNTTNKCELCGNDCEATKHHLIPQAQSRHKNKYLKTDEGNYLWVCTECHSQIHALFSNYELKTLYNTKEALLSEPRMHKFVEWRRKHPDFKGSSKMAKERRPKR